MQHSRNQLKKGLKAHMEQVGKSSSDPSTLLSNPEYRTAACLLSIMEKQDAVVETVPSNPAPRKI